MTQRLALVLALAALLGGCGGSGDATSSGRAYGILYVKPGLTRQKFLAHVNGVCRRSWRLIENAVRQSSAIAGTADPQTSELQRYATGVHNSYFAAIGVHIYTRIQHLGAPRGEKQAVEDVLRAMQDGMRQGPRTPISNPAQVEAVFSDYNQLARRYGLDECLVAGSHLPRPEGVRGHA